MQFIYPILIREHHLDTFGHVNNATYLQLLEDARWEILYPRNFGINDIIRTGLGPTIVEINIRFSKELKLRDQIEIRSEMISYEKKIGILKQDIYRGGECCSEAQLKMGLFDIKARRLVPPTPEWLYAIGVTEVV